MDIVLGVSMTPTTVRMVLVEGENADGVTVDHDTFDITTGEGSATAAEQVIAAILGTRESAVEGGHRLVSTGVTWTDHAAAAALRDALSARRIDDVVLVSELHAAGALAQAVGAAVGYERTALMFLERDTATLSVVETATGAIVKVQTESLHAQDAVAELQRMVAALEHLDQPPQGLFILGSGVDVAAVKSQLSLGTTLTVHAPEDAELALARGAGLASATTPRYEASTVGLAYAQDRDGTTAGSVYPAGADTEMSDAGTQMAAAGYMAPLGYSEVADEPDYDPSLGYDAALGYDAVPGELDFSRDEPERKPFLLVGSALTSIFVVGVVALVISLAVSIRPTVDQRPSPGQNAIVSTSQAPAPAAPEAAAPPPPSTPSVPDTIQEPMPVVQQAPRTVYVTPAPQAPASVAPAPAAPAPAPAPEAPAPAPVAPAPVIPAPVPVAPIIPAPVLPPPVIVVPRQLIPPFLRPPRAPQQEYPSGPPSYPSGPPSYPSSPSYPSQEPSYPSGPSVTEAPSYPNPGAGSGGYGSGGGGYGSGGSGSSSDSGSGSDSPRSGGSGGSGRGSGGGSQSPLWPWPSFGGH